MEGGATRGQVQQGMEHVVALWKTDVLSHTAVNITGRENHPSPMCVAFELDMAAAMLGYAMLC